MATKGGMMKRDRSKPVILDCTIDYDGEEFYARAELEHRVDLPGRYRLYGHRGSGELRVTRGGRVLDV